MEKIIEAYKFVEEFNKILDEFRDEHPDETDDDDFVFKISGPFFSLTLHMSESFSDQKPNADIIAKKIKILQSEQDVLFKKILVV